MRQCWTAPGLSEISWFLGGLGFRGFGVLGLGGLGFRGVGVCKVVGAVRAAGNRDIVECEGFRRWAAYSGKVNEALEGFGLGAMAYGV